MTQTSPLATRRQFLNLSGPLMMLRPLGRIRLVPLVLFMGLTGIAVMMGGLTVLGGPVMAMFLAGGLGALMLLALDPRAIIWLLFTLVYLVIGQLTYFGGISQAYWVPYLMTMLLLVKLPLEMLMPRHHRVTTSRQLSAATLALIAYLAMFALSALFNETDALTLIVTGKNYVFVWSLCAFIALGLVDEATLLKLWRFFLVIALVQLPFALVERLFMAKRNGGVNWDAVVGTFGGNYLVGGASGVMAYFLVFAMLLASALYSQSRISARLHWTVLIGSFCTIALAEVKVVFFIIPLGYAWLFRHALIRMSLQATVWAIALVAGLAIVFTVYKSLDYDGVSTHEMTLEENLDRIASIEFDPYFYNPLTRETTRVSALTFWWMYNPPATPLKFLIGNGPGASHESQTIGVGSAAKKYPFTLSTSAASSLLWDIGLLGYAAFLAILFFGAMSAERLSRNMAIPEDHRLIMRANAAALLIAAVLTTYNRDAIEGAPMQFLLAAMLGHVLLMRSRY